MELLAKHLLPFVETAGSGYGAAECCGDEAIMSKPARHKAVVKNGVVTGVRRTNPPKTVKGKIIDKLIKKVTGQ